jgi:hypothetical protein
MRPLNSKWTKQLAEAGTTADDMPAILAALQVLLRDRIRSSEHPEIGECIVTIRIQQLLQMWSAARRFECAVNDE